MPTPRNVLVTGLSGLIGGAFRSHHGARYQLTALNRRPVDGVRTHCADITDANAILPAFSGQDAVVHLAAKANDQFSWDDLRDGNITGTYNVFEAARRAGVRRVVYASSGTTVAGYERDEPYRSLVTGDYARVPAQWPLITPATPTRPRGIYGTTKVWGEALARHFADTTDMTFIALRIGFVSAADRPEGARAFSVWCSQRDIANAIACALDATCEARYGVCFVQSRNRWGYRDAEAARELIGFTAEMPPRIIVEPAVSRFVAQRSLANFANGPRWHHEHDEHLIT